MGPRDRLRRRRPLPPPFAAAPAVELHLHLEGAVSGAALVALSSRARAHLPGSRRRRARRRRLGSPEAFFALYRDVCRQLRSAADYALVARDLTPRLARERIRHAEVYVSPAVVEKIGLDWLAVRAALEAVFAAHEGEGAGASASCSTSCATGARRPPTASSTSTASEPWPRAVGFGLGGDENGFPARDFAEAFRRARRLGLLPVVHAGEWAGPESVAEALVRLRPVRIAHGIRAVEDPALLRLLARSGVVCDVCPTSNLATGAFPAGTAHRSALSSRGRRRDALDGRSRALRDDARGGVPARRGVGATGAELPRCAATARHAAARTRS